jgi:hypothetical protein
MKKFFRDILEASMFYNILKTAISNACAGRSKTAGGYEWAYI